MGECLQTWISSPTVNELFLGEVGEVNELRFGEIGRIDLDELAVLNDLIRMVSKIFRRFRDAPTMTLTSPMIAVVFDISRGKASMFGLDLCVEKDECS